MKLVEAARQDIGDYDQVGENVRFFDPQDARPEAPRLLWLQKRPAKGKGK